MRKINLGTPTQAEHTIALAPAALYRDKRVGSIGHFGCFRFQTHKNM